MQKNDEKKKEQPKSPSSNPLHNPAKTPVEFPPSPDENPLPREVEFGNQETRAQDAQANTQTNSRPTRETDLNAARGGSEKNRTTQSTKTIEDAPDLGDEQAP